MIFPAPLVSMAFHVKYSHHHHHHLRSLWSLSIVRISNSHNPAKLYSPIHYTHLTRTILITMIIQLHVAIRCSLSSSVAPFAPAPGRRLFAHRRPPCERMPFQTLRRCAVYRKFVICPDRVHLLFANSPVQFPCKNNNNNSNNSRTNR